MPGQCYSCGTEFSIFKKEHGCKNCGYSCCNKCLHSKSISVPKRNNAKHHVCIQCYKILTGQEKEDQSETQYELPQAYLKRMEALKEREQSRPHAEHVGVRGQKLPAHFSNLDKPDREIAARLERLRESDKPKEKITNADITARLANLQGQPYKPQQKPIHQPPDRRLQGQQVDDLLDEIGAEVEIDLQTDPAKDIQTRLDRLRNDTDDKSKGLKQDQDFNNLNKESYDQKKEGMYKKNIGNVTKESQSGTDVDMLEIQRLMEAAALETEVDAQKAVRGMEKDTELMDRLKKLQAEKREKESNKSTCTDTGEDNEGFKNSDSSEEDEDEAAKRIVQRYLEESKIDDNVGDFGVGEEIVHGKRQPSRTGKPLTPSYSQKDQPGNDKDDDDDYEDKDELPYCCLCTEDAVIRCRDCDMDLFCQRCFRECHKEMDIDDHRTTPYKAPKGYH